MCRRALVIGGASRATVDTDMLATEQEELLRRNGVFGGFFQSGSSPPGRSLPRDVPSVPGGGRLLRSERSAATDAQHVSWSSCIRSSWASGPCQRWIWARISSSTCR
jgi:hypothetical protein